MSKKLFYKRLLQLAKEAQLFIEQQFSGNKKVINLCDPDKNDGDAVFEMPELAHYSHNGGFVGWGNIYKLKKRKHKYRDWMDKNKWKTMEVIEVHFILKEFGERETVFLTEMDNVHIIELASYLQS